MHSTEDDHVGFGCRGLSREPERIADVVGNVLHVGQLVVVREDDGVALACKRAHLLMQRVYFERSHSTSRETSSERAEWVSAPTEMKSTPASA